MRHRIVSLIGLPVIAALHVDCRCTLADDAMDLPTLTAALRAQLSSIASIDVKYEKVYHDPEGPAQIEDDEWVEQGECRALTRIARQPERKPDSLLFNGAKGYSYTWDPSGQQEGRLVITNAISPGNWTRSLPANFIGLRVSQCDKSLVELMERPGAELVGPETLAGHSCWRIRLTDFEGLRGAHMQMTACLDPERDFLPAEITVRFADEEIARHPEATLMKDLHQTWAVDEFMRVNDAASRGQRWFPKTATLHQQFNAIHTFTVTSAVLNEVIPAARFRPQTPDGTVLADIDAAGGAKFSVQGGTAASDPMAERASQEALKELAGHENAAPMTTNARPRRASWPAYILFGCSLLACALVAFFWFRVNRT